MRSFILLIILALALPAAAQQRPSADEAAFSRLPPDLQAMLEHLPPREALQKVEFARQNLIALGVPNPSPEQLRATVARVIGPSYGPVEGASAGATTFPPLSPLVPPQAPPLR
ncbi:MAG TPA: hypothetical protein VFZ81_03525 [Burkholderiales bacterium]